jgi:hypothetical protein
MVKNISRARLAAFWVATVIVVAACSVFWGFSLTLNTGALWLAACVVPPAVMFLVWRGAPPITVAELLYSVNQSSKDTRS